MWTVRVNGMILNCYSDFRTAYLMATAYGKENYVTMKYVASMRKYS